MTALDWLILSAVAIAVLALAMCLGDWIAGWHKRRADRVRLAGKVLRCHMGFAEPRRRLR